jgi:tRNA (guanosine-2'-O-)-methyltransferase
MKRDDLDARSPLRHGPQLPWERGWTAQGLIDLLEPLVVDARARRLEEVVSKRTHDVAVLFDRPRDPHNGGAVIRSCDAFGVQELHVLPLEQSFLVSTRITQGTDRWVDVLEHRSNEAAITHLVSRGYEMILTHPQGELLPEDLAAIPRLALVLGNEQAGVSPELTAACRRGVRIPMRGFVESLNVSVSAALLLSAATRGREGTIAEADRLRLYARGLYRTVSRADEVLAASRPR